jgi:hypothetical protein
MEFTTKDTKEEKSDKRYVGAAFDLLSKKEAHGYSGGWYRKFPRSGERSHDAFNRPFAPAKPSSVPSALSVWFNL